MGEPSAGVLGEATARIPEDQRALVGMLLDGSSEREVGAMLGLTPQDVQHAVQRLLRQLRLSSPAAEVA